MLAPESTALAFHRACDRAGVAYVIVGGLAVAAWGIPRATADVDALVVIDAARLVEFKAALQSEGLDVDERDLADARRDGSHVTIFDPRTQYHVDVKPALTADEQRQAAEAVLVALAGGALRVATAEDTVAYKLLYGSPQDLHDARSILERQAQRLDVARLRSLARRLGVSAKLENLLRE